MMGRKTVLKDLIINHGVISDSEKTILSAVEDEMRGAEITDGQVKVFPDETVIDPVDAQFPQISADDFAQTAFDEAGQVTSRAGKQFLSYTDDELRKIVSLATASAEQKNAAQIRLDYKSILEKKAAIIAGELGF